MISFRRSVSGERATFHRAGDESDVIASAWRDAEGTYAITRWHGSPTPEERERVARLARLLSAKRRCA